MLLIDQAASEAIQPELLDGESILWAGRPLLRTVFHQEDLFLVPFSLLWGGFAIFWEGSVLGLFGSPSRGDGSPGFFVLWGIPFVLVGQYMIWGRFVNDAWKKTKTHYAITNRRAIVMQNAWRFRTASCYVESISSLTKESGSGTLGTLRFGPRPQIFARSSGWGAWDAMSVHEIPIFRDIDNIDEVYRLVGRLREERRSG